MSDHEDAEAKRIGRLIAELRRKQGLSQQDLAHQLGNHVSTVSRWERGEHEGYAVNARKLARALKVHPSLLRPVELDVETQLDRIEGKLDRLLALSGAQGLSPEEEADLVLEELEGELGKGAGGGRPGEAPRRSEGAAPARRRRRGAPRRDR